METKFTVSEVIATSWKALKSQIWILVGLFIGIMIISLLINLLLIPLAKGSIIGVVLANVLYYAITLIFSMGYLKNIFQALDGEEPQFSAYGQQAPKIITMFVASLLFGIVVGVGCIFLIIPGVYLGLRLQFYQAFIIEENSGIMDSLRKSWEVTQGQTMNLFILLLAAIGIMIAGFLLLGIGIFVAAPLVYIMYCHVFRILNSPLQMIEE